MKPQFQNASASFKKRNPELFGNLGGLPAQAAKSTAPQALVSRKPRIKKGSGDVVARVTFISLRRRLIDPDAVSISTKYLQDAVCETLGYDDGDPRIVFEYRQELTNSKTGVIVKIDL